MVERGAQPFEAQGKQECLCYLGLLLLAFAAFPGGGLFNYSLSCAEA